MRQAETADLFGEPRAEQAEIGIAFQRVADRGQDMHRAIDQFGLLAVGKLVMRQEIARRRLFGQFEDRIGGVAVDEVGDAEPVMEQEIDILTGKQGHMRLR